eukprot:1160365-Pelagomonas_calceolata.AAC.2
MRYTHVATASWCASSSIFRLGLSKNCAHTDTSWGTQASVGCMACVGAHRPVASAQASVGYMAYRRVLDAWHVSGRTGRWPVMDAWHVLGHAGRWPVHRPVLDAWHTGQ